MTFFAEFDDDAEARFERFFDIDPFTDIPPALLNSTDIRSYVGATGMIHPFVNSDDKLKTASYEVDLLGKCVYWDENGRKQLTFVEEGDEFILRPNSIAFVTLRPMFRLPQYIALRFNLKITHVYRGILLGTGPLVDPGYRNRLSIPLHNLTSNKYVFRGGEGLIWMEFTKLSPSGDAAKQPPPGMTLPSKWSGSVVKFPERKNELRDVEHYIRKAEPHRSVRSSIPLITQEARKAIEELRRTVTSLGVGGIILGGIAITLGVYPIASLVHDVSNTAQLTRDLLSDAQGKLEAQQKKTDQVKAELDALRREIRDKDPKTKPDASSADTKKSK